MFEYFWGRSTFRYPDTFSISYLRVSDGTTSMKHCTRSGTWPPGEIPCHGWALNNTPSNFHNGCAASLTGTNLFELQDQFTAAIVKAADGDRLMFGVDSQVTGL